MQVAAVAVVGMKVALEDEVEAAGSELEVKEVEEKVELARP